MRSPRACRSSSSKTVAPGKTEPAGDIAKEIASILGGSGGGDAKFAQGGGKDTSKKDTAVQKAKSMILG